VGKTFTTIIKKYREVNIVRLNVITPWNRNVIHILFFVLGFGAVVLSFLVLWQF
jgi:hypothetical protein